MQAAHGASTRRHPPTPLPLRPVHFACGGWPEWACWRAMSIAMLISLLFAANLSHAGTLAGVTMSDTATVGGTPVSLNGMGLREKYFIDIYVGGLYLANPTHDGAAVLAESNAKRVVMQFVYREVTREQMVSSFQDDFGNQPGFESAKKYTEQIVSWLPNSVKRGDTLAFEYVPGSGTTMSYNGAALGTVADPAFAKVVFGVYVGAKPPTEALKKGLLGL